MLQDYQGMKPRLAKGVFLAPSADLIGNVIIEEDSSIWYQCVLRGDINSIKIGKQTNIQDHSVLHVSDDYGVEIGACVSVGHRATLHACKIHNSVLVGMGATVLDGAQVGSHSIIGAHALVPKGKVIPEGSLVVGAPARVIRSITEEEKSYIDHLAEKYVRVKNNYGKLN